jgi:hypothetical protein
MNNITQEDADKIKEYNDKLLKQKERIWLKQFNDNFNKYKDIVKQAAYERDSSNLDEMSLDATTKANRKFIYNNFPLILGIIFVIFGLIIYFMKDDSNKLQQVQPQINPVFMGYPAPPPPMIIESAASQSPQKPPINIPINITTTTGKRLPAKKKSTTGK